MSVRNRLHFEDGEAGWDIRYIENWPWLDLKNMLKTLPVMFRGDNTY